MLVKINCEEVLMMLQDDGDKLHWLISEILKFLYAREFFLFEEFYVKALLTVSGIYVGAKVRIPSVVTYFDMDWELLWC